MLIFLKKLVEDRLLYATETGIQQGMQQGVAKGRQEGQQGVLLNLLEHMKPAQVAKMTKLPLKEVLAARKKRSKV